MAVFWHMVRLDKNPCSLDHPLLFVSLFQLGGGGGGGGGILAGNSAKVKQGKFPTTCQANWQLFAILGNHPIIAPTCCSTLFLKLRPTAGLHSNKAKLPSNAHAPPSLQRYRNPATGIKEQVFVDWFVYHLLFPWFRSAVGLCYSDFFFLRFLSHSPLSALSSSHFSYILLPHLPPPYTPPQGSSSFPPLCSQCPSSLSPSSTVLQKAGQRGSTARSWSACSLEARPSKPLHLAGCEPEALLPPPVLPGAGTTQTSGPWKPRQAVGRRSHRESPLTPSFPSGSPHGPVRITAPASWTRLESKPAWSRASTISSSSLVHASRCAAWWSLTRSKQRRSKASMKTIKLKS